MLPGALSIPRAGLYPVTIALQRDGRILSTRADVPQPPAGGRRGAGRHRADVGGDGHRHAQHRPPRQQRDHQPRRPVDHCGDDGTGRHVGCAEHQQVPVDGADRTCGAQRSPGPRPALFAPADRRRCNSIRSSPNRNGRIDPSAAAAAGQGSLYTSWLRDGQDRLASLGLGPAVVSQSTIFVDQPIERRGLRRCAATSAPG